MSGLLLLIRPVSNKLSKMPATLAPLVEPQPRNLGDVWFESHAVKAVPVHFNHSLLQRYTLGVSRCTMYGPAIMHYCTCTVIFTAMMMLYFTDIFIQCTMCMYIHVHVYIHSTMYMHIHIIVHVHIHACIYMFLN